MVTQASLTSDISFGLGLLASLGGSVDTVGIYSNGAGQGSSASSGITGLSPSILNSILGISNVTASIGQLFVNARPMKATVRETSKLMEHPVETGTVLADHHIINPVEIDIPLIVNSQFYAATYSQIRQNFINATPMAVKTRVGVYSDMIIADMPHEETPDMFDVITINLHLKQVIYALSGGGTSDNFQPLSADNSNTIASGLQQASALGTQLLAGASGISTYAAVLRL